MRALVTGGNGFLGSHLCRELLHQGHQVRALAQPETDVDRLRGLELELCRGDLLQPESLVAACAGRDVVFHLAGVVQDWGPASLFQRVNVEGTRQLLRAAAAAGVRRLVFTSSLAVHRYVGISDGDEEWPLDNQRHPYGGSKIDCEQLLARAHREGQLETVVVRPGVFPFGPDDRLVLPELLRHRGSYRHVARGQARLCTAYAPNLAYGISLCGSVPAAAGRTYVIADDETPSWAELMTLLFEALGLAPPARSVPRWLALGAAGLAEAWAAISRHQPLINLYRVRLAGRDCVFRADRAKRELGWSPAVSLVDAVAETARWARQTMPELLHP